jgi:hypothetical protein
MPYCSYNLPPSTAVFPGPSRAHRAGPFSVVCERGTGPLVTTVAPLRSSRRHAAGSLTSIPALRPVLPARSQAEACARSRRTPQAELDLLTLAARDRAVSGLVRQMGRDRAAIIAQVLDGPEAQERQVRVGGGPNGLPAAMASPPMTCPDCFRWLQTGRVPPRLDSPLRLAGPCP